MGGVLAFAQALTDNPGSRPNTGLDMDDLMLRKLVAETSARTVHERLNRVSSGNVSARFDTGFLVTPSGVPSVEVRPEQVVFVDLDGRWSGSLKPSSEWRFHRDLYAARPEVGAVVHVHSPFAVSMACLRRSIPSFNYMIAAAGGKTIPCADYATFGTQALSDNILAAMGELRACLMANHGQVAVGRDLQQALAVAIEVESLCEQYWRACQLGEPVLLTDAEMDEALAAFQGYGVNR